MNHPHARMPQCLQSHAKEYDDHSWKDYTMEELGHAVALFTKRSQHRSNPKKMAKDLYDASNYLAMMRAHIDQYILDMGVFAPRKPEPAERSKVKKILDSFL